MWLGVRSVGCEPRDFLGDEPMLGATFGSKLAVVPKGDGGRDGEAGCVAG